jgi:hypothetical protein
MLATRARESGYGTNRFHPTEGGAATAEAVSKTRDGRASNLGRDRWWLRFATKNCVVLDGVMGIAVQCPEAEVFDWNFHHFVLTECRLKHVNETSDL